VGGWSLRFFVLLCCCLAVTGADGRAAPVVACRVIDVLPHDPTAFTQGLVYHDGLLYESTGGYGTSELRAVDPATGRVLRRHRLAADRFGEGLALVGGQLVQLTWKSHIGYGYDRERFAIRRTFVYDHEGWGAAWDGDFLYVSDGTAVIRRYDAATFRERDRIVVRDDGKPVTKLNELETVDGELLANVWKSDRIARIDPATGTVLGWLDCQALTARVASSDPEAVLNGIAWDRERRRLLVTGKRWPWLFIIAPPGHRDGGASP